MNSRKAGCRSQTEKIRALRDIVTEYNRTLSTTGHLQISNSEAVAEVLRPVYQGLKHEECWVLFLNRANRIIKKEMLFKGGADSTVFDVKTIVRKALVYSASAVIISHNHPSGSAKPSTADIKQTEALHKALKYMDIHLLDHIIIAEDSFYSLSDSMQYYFNSK
ncbi:MAG: JAB domain-containing protein [Bacteroidales bacterium]|nr:JAB domain-containing protein [Bacteroidales bacterium]